MRFARPSTQRKPSSEMPIKVWMFSIRGLFSGIPGLPAKTRRNHDQRDHVVRFFVFGKETPTCEHAQREATRVHTQARGLLQDFHRAHKALLFLLVQSSLTHACVHLKERESLRLAAFSPASCSHAVLSSRLVQAATMVLSWVSVPCSSTCPTYLLSNSWSENSTPCYFSRNRRPYQRMRACHHDDGEAAVARVSTRPQGAEDVQQPLSRGAVLRRATSSLVVGSAALGALDAPAAALDPQRDARTAQPPPPALLLPVVKLRVRVSASAADGLLVNYRASA